MFNHTMSMRYYMSDLAYIPKGIVVEGERFFSMAHAYQALKVLCAGPYPKRSMRTGALDKWRREQFASFAREMRQDIDPPKSSGVFGVGVYGLASKKALKKRGMYVMDAWEGNVRVESMTSIVKCRIAQDVDYADLLEISDDYYTMSEGGHASYYFHCPTNLFWGGYPVGGDWVGSNMLGRIMTQVFRPTTHPEGRRPKQKAVKAIEHEGRVLAMKRARMVANQPKARSLYATSLHPSCLLHQLILRLHKDDSEVTRASLDECTFYACFHHAKSFHRSVMDRHLIAIADSEFTLQAMRGHHRYIIACTLRRIRTLLGLPLCVDTLMRLLFLYVKPRTPFVYAFGTVWPKEFEVSVSFPGDNHGPRHSPPPESQAPTQAPGGLRKRSRSPNSSIRDDTHGPKRQALVLSI
jgi:hypothetical protein